MGCVQDFAPQLKSPIQAQSSEPKWLNDPFFIKDKRNAIGCAEQHFKGLAEQKKLAISRAIEQIALQKSSKVSAVTYRNRSSNSGSNSSQTSSLQEVDSQNITTKIVDTFEYKDGSNAGRMCVLVVEE